MIPSAWPYRTSGNIVWVSFVFLFYFYTPFLICPRAEKNPCKRRKFKAYFLEYKALLHRALLTAPFLLTLGPSGGDSGRRWRHLGGQPSVPTA